MIRSVWIVGASSGIGRELALSYAREGCRVAISARSKDALDEVTRQERGITAYPLDVLKISEFEKAFKAIESDMGLPDLVILNAGTHSPTPAEDFDRKQVNDIIAVNLTGMVNGISTVMPRMMEEGHGHLVLVASVAGYRGLPNAAAYCASKAGVIAMAESLKPALDQAGVRIQVVTPGFVRTPLTDRNDFPMPFLIEVEDAVARIKKGIERGGFEITFPKRFTYLLKLMRILPYRLYFGITRRML
jgi:short-subunit dehydrogenase